MAQYLELLKRAYAKWSEDEAMRLGAALSYYTIFSIAPLLIVLIAVIGLVFGQEAARGQIVGEIQSLVGQDVARSIEEMIRRANQPRTGTIAMIIGLVTLVVGASGVVAELKASLNKIWGIQEPASLGFMGMMKRRLFSFAMVLGVGFLLLVSLVVSAALAGAERFVEGILPLPEVVLHMANLALSFLVITTLFALIYKFLPDAEIAWGDVWKGAAFTAVLFVIGKFGLGMYIGKAGVADAYGAAGSLVVLLVWVYYSSLIFFFGAEVTQVYANSYGSRIQPEGQPAAEAAHQVASPDREPRPEVAAAQSRESRKPVTRSGGELSRPPGKMAAMGGLAIAAGVIGLRFWNRYNGGEKPRRIGS